MVKRNHQRIPPGFRDNAMFNLSCMFSCRFSCCVVWNPGADALTLEWPIFTGEKTKIPD
jgi:hypothetical protein